MQIPLRVLALGLAWTSFVSPATTDDVSSPSDASLRQRSRLDRVVVVALDGVRHHEVFGGVDSELLADAPLEVRARFLGLSSEELIPTLHNLASVEGAAIGAFSEGPILASGPNFVSLPGYREMLTGRPSTDCTDNHCPKTRELTIADEFAARGSSVVVASWSGLRRAGAGTVDVHMDAGRDVEGKADWHDPRAFPGHGDYRPDEQTARIALRTLREEAPEFLFVSLGDTDEYGHRGNYAKYLGALQRADGFVREVWRHLQTLESKGTRTLLMVTTDHGRASNFRDHGGFAPESARVWLIAGGSGIARQGLVQSPRPRALADIAPTIRHLAGLAPKRGEAQGETLTELLEARRH